jgi:hypothetical protein
LLDISPLLQDAASAVVDDSFLRCFQSAPSDNWNWNLYLFPLWCVGVVLRTFILFPIRYAQQAPSLHLCNRADYLTMYFTEFCCPHSQTYEFCLYSSCVPVLGLRSHNPHTLCHCMVPSHLFMKRLGAVHEQSWTSMVIHVNIL